MSAQAGGHRPLAVAPLVALLLALLAGCVPSGASGAGGIKKEAPPVLFRWTTSAAAGAATPQAAFAAGMRLDLCQPAAARLVTTTWLAAGPDFGVAWVVADCGADRADPRPVQSLFLIRRDRQDGPTCDHWTGDNAGFSVKPPAGPVPDAVRARMPAWLPLPPDAYLELPTTTDVPPRSSVHSWLSATHAFLAGRFEGLATRPAAGATTVSVAGNTGWLVQDGGMASVVVPLATGETYFFSGTAAPDQLLPLAAQTLAHLEEALPLPPLRAPADRLYWC
jgi:hypothetical protein